MYEYFKVLPFNLQEIGDLGHCPQIRIWLMHLVGSAFREASKEGPT